METGHPRGREMGILYNIVVSRGRERAGRDLWRLDTRGRNFPRVRFQGFQNQIPGIPGSDSRDSRVSRVRFQRFQSQIPRIPGIPGSDSRWLNFWEVV